MLMMLKKYKLFYISILSGLFVWFFSFVILPAKTVENFKIETFLFILACYVSLIAGFVLVNFKGKIKRNVIKNDQLIKILMLFFFFCFFVRWIDLFHFRSLSFSNNFIENRKLNEVSATNSTIFILASIFKSAYFFPFVIVLRGVYRKKNLLILSVLLLFFPFVEAMLLGTRITFFETALIVLVSLLILKKIKISFFNIIGFVLAAFVLVTVSYKILIKREIVKGNEDSVYEVITKGKYNDLLKPSEEIVEYINDPKVEKLKKNYVLIFLQMGQYINHGVFEFNHIIGSNLPIAYGRYSMYPFFKFFDKIVVKKHYENFNPSPRRFVYLTAFGSFYIDFRWASLIVFFLFGIVQKYFHSNFKSSIIHTPIVVYLAIINVFLPIFNYLRGAGIYPFVSFALILVISQFITKKVNEKSIST